MSETVEILGCKIKLTAEAQDSVKAMDVIELINKEASEIKKRQPGLSNADTAVMVALKIAADRLAIEQDFKGNIEFLEKTIDNSLQVIDEVSPSVN